MFASRNDEMLMRSSLQFMVGESIYQGNGGALIFVKVIRPYLHNTSARKGAKLMAPLIPLGVQLSALGWMPFTRNSEQLGIFESLAL